VENEQQLTQDQLMNQILQVGSVFNNKLNEAQGLTIGEGQDKFKGGEVSEDTDDENQQRPTRKSPEMLRKEIYEIHLRKRIFLTDRMEKLEKLLILHNLVSESQLASQHQDGVDSA
jgi:hypothetical protein